MSVEVFQALGPLLPPITLSTRTRFLLPEREIKAGVLPSQSRRSNIGLEPIQEIPTVWCLEAADGSIVWRNQVDHFAW